MSKCQARKYLAGGRCGGSSSSTFSSLAKEDTTAVNTSFQHLLAQREAMDANMWAQSKDNNKQALVVIQQTQQKQLKEKQKDIDISCILGNDFE